MEIYYFGCVDVPGHYMHTADLRTANRFLYDNPWGLTIDGGLCPRGRSPHVVSQLKDGYTALAFWDNSIDTRPGSNSAFIAKGVYTTEQMWALAKQYFPEIISRAGFPKP